MKPNNFLILFITITFGLFIYVTNHIFNLFQCDQFRGFELHILTLGLLIFIGIMCLTVVKLFPLYIKVYTQGNKIMSNKEILEIIKESIGNKTELINNIKMEIEKSEDLKVSKEEKEAILKYLIQNEEELDNRKKYRDKLLEIFDII